MKFFIWRKDFWFKGKILFAGKIFDSKRNFFWKTNFYSKEKFLFEEKFSYSKKIFSFLWIAIKNLFNARFVRWKISSLKNFSNQKIFLRMKRIFSSPKKNSIVSPSSSRVNNLVACEKIAMNLQKMQFFLPLDEDFSCRSRLWLLYKQKNPYTFWTKKINKIMEQNAELFNVFGVSPFE